MSAEDQLEQHKKRWATWPEWKKRVFEQMYKKQDLHWSLPKSIVVRLEALGCVTEKEGKKWAFGGWLHEDQYTGTKG